MIENKNKENNYKLFLFQNLSKAMIRNLNIFSNISSVNIYFYAKGLLRYALCFGSKLSLVDTLFGTFFEFFNSIRYRNKKQVVKEFRKTNKIVNASVLDTSYFHI